MAFGSTTVFEADVAFRADYAQFEGDAAKIRESAMRTYGALDEGAVAAALASEKYDRALARSRGSSYAVAKATAAYKRELEQIAGAEQRAAHGSTGHSSALKQEERSLGGVFRGALAGSGALTRLGRAAIFASSSVLGGYGLVYALKSTVDAAREHEIAVGHAQVAVENSGHSWLRQKDAIEEALGAQVKLTGFTDSELTESFARFVRRFGDVNEALHANALAADVARAKNIDLASASDLVQRASFGNPRALRALDIEITKTTTNMDALKASTNHATAEQIANAKAADVQASKTGALAAVQAKYHGEAARFLQTDTGKQQLFNAELERSREIIGGALLPTFNDMLVKLSAWLDKMNRSGKLQRDVNQAVRTGEHVVHDFGAALHVVDDVTGSFQNTLELLLALKVASVLTGWAVGAGKFARALRGVAGAEKAVAEANVASEITGIGGAATTAAGEVGGLAGEVRGLRAALLALPVGKFGVAGALIGAGLIVKDAVHDIRNNKKELAREVILSQKNGTTIYGENGHIYSETIPYGGGEPVTVDITNTPQGRRYQPAYSRELSRRATDRYLAKHPLDRVDSHELNPRSNVPGSPNYVPPEDRHPRRGRGGPSVGLTYAQQNRLLEAEGTASTSDDAAALHDEVAILNRQLQQKGLNAQQRNEILSARNDALSQLQQIQQDNARTRSAATRKAAAARRKHFLTLTEIPAQLVARQARLEQKNAPAAQIVKVLNAEEAALRRQDAQLRREHAPEEFDAKIAREEEQLHKRIQAVLKKQRRKRISALEAVPVDLQLAESTARAHNASEERIVAILEKEKAALERQIATLRRIGASKEEILKARQNEARVQAKIDAAQKKPTQGSGLARELQDAVAGLAEYAPNVVEALATVRGGPAVHVENHQHFPHPPSDDGRREAIYTRHALEAVFS